MLSRFVMLALVIASFFDCGCRTAGMPAGERRDIMRFVEKQTGEKVSAVNREKNGDFQVLTDITNGGFSREHIWKIKRVPDGWALISEGLISM